MTFDVGHGNNSFSFSMALPALQQGFPPDTISTDLHRMSLHTSRANMTEVMSKFLAIGMPMRDIVEKSTWAPARKIGHPELGTLTPGAPADVAVLEFVRRPAGLSDCGPTGYRIMQAGRQAHQPTHDQGRNREVRLRRSGKGRLVRDAKYRFLEARCQKALRVPKLTANRVKLVAALQSMQALASMLKEARSWPASRYATSMMT